MSDIWNRWSQFIGKAFDKLPDLQSVLGVKRPEDWMSLAFLLFLVFISAYINSRIFKRMGWNPAKGFLVGLIFNFFFCPLIGGFWLFVLIGAPSKRNGI